jgi:predicted DsbA family dithiol-disulfide isomerase
MTAKTPLLIDMVADIVCPWCFVGLHSLLQASEALARDRDVTLRFRPYQLNPDLPVEGVDREAHYSRKFPDAARRAQMRIALIEAAKAAGAEAFDPLLPRHLPNTLNAHRAMRLAAAEGAALPFAGALYDAFWLKGRDIGATATLADIAADAGLDRADFLARLERGERREETIADAEGLRDAGVAGVPTYIINERRGFSGALPPHDLEAAIREAAQISKGATS